ncbi:hypothetical protein KBD61_00545 [Patescibacteria group bacterium]|nr:hypothetical protein [Patescibacteria group bacterium]MBP9709495.1 hypothetical protein [Patescibacteria group bacterium]
MNILLLGIIGSGKTSVGQRLAELLTYQFMELDEVVLAHGGGAVGEDPYVHNQVYWSECELEVSKDISLDTKQVIATGGGFAENNLNILYFKEHGPVAVIYLHATPETLSDRFLSIIDKERIARHELTDKMGALYARRDAQYRVCADLVVDTDKKTVKEVVSKMNKYLKQTYPKHFGG